MPSNLDFVRSCPAGEGEFAVHIEIQKLIEPLAAHVHAEFRGVLAKCLGEVIGPLERVAGLRQFAFKVIADREATANVDEGHADVTWKVGGDARGKIRGAVKQFVVGTAAPQESCTLQSVLTGWLWFAWPSRK